MHTPLSRRDTGCCHQFLFPEFNPLIRRLVSGMPVLLGILGLFAAFPAAVWAQADEPAPGVSRTAPAFTESGMYYIQNFNQDEYGAHQQNWCVVQDDRGVMYFGNNLGLLEYDGVSWRILEGTKNQFILTLCKHPDGRIFAGSDGDFGVLQADSVGVMRYHSLVPELDEEKRDFGRVWSMHALGDRIYFQTDYRLMEYHDGRFRSWSDGLTDGSGYILSYVSNGHIYLNTSDKRLLKLENDQLREVPLNQPMVGLVAMLPYSSSQTMMVTEVGLYLFSDSLLMPFESEADEYFQMHPPYTAIQLRDKTYAIATFTGGIVIVDRQGRMRRIINKDAGLQDDQGLFLYEDREGGLWAALYNGISRIEVPSPLTYFSDQQGLRGSVQSILRHDGYFYVSTSQGIFWRKEGLEHGKIVPFQQIPEINFQSWQLVPFQDELFLLTSQRMYRLEGNRAVIVKRSEKGTALTVPDYPDLLLLAGDDTLEVWDYGSNRPRLRAKYTVEGSIRSMELDSKRQLWLGTVTSGVYRIHFKNGFGPDAEVVHFDTARGLPSNTQNVVCRVRNRVLIATESGIYSYDRGKKSFQPDTMLGSQFTQPGLHIFRIKEGPDGKVYVFTIEDENHEWITVLTPQPGGSYKADDVPFRRAGNFATNVIYPEPDGVVWVGGVEGLLRYNPAVRKDYGSREHALIRKIRVEEDSLLFGGAYFDPEDRSAALEQNEVLIASLPFDLNSMRFECASPGFDAPEATMYRFYLEGFDRQWSEWTKEPFKSYTNIPEGSYTFRVRARNIYRQLSVEGTYQFKIFPPWYRTWWAYTLYVVLLVGSVYLFVRWRLRRLEAENRKLEQIVTERTRQVVQQKEEIEQKASELQRSYNNVTLLSKIGQELTATLDEADIYHTLNRYITALVDIDYLGIFRYQPDREILESRLRLVNGEKLSPVELPVEHEPSYLAVWCLKQRQEILMHDYGQEYRQYLPGTEPREEDRKYPSQIYLPLLMEDKVLGVISVQNERSNAFASYQLDILKTLGAYTAIALDNANAYHEIELQKENLTEAYREIEFKNAEITDSIVYAGRIQESILPSDQEIQQRFRDSFILYKPRDIVSGDFYWFSTKEDCAIIAAVDCTGHGVPGAFMSVMGNSLLNQIVNENDILNPSDILTHLDYRVRVNLHQLDPDSNSRDGMDLSLCSIDFQNQICQFAGANNPIYYIRNGELTQYKASKNPIGGGQYEDKQFVCTDIPFQPDDTVYLFSDGYADQFGGPKNKKFMYKKFQRLLLEIHQLPMAEQRQRLDEEIEAWRGTQEQVDDILVIGVRF